MATGPVNTWRTRVLSALKRYHSILSKHDPRRINAARHPSGQQNVTEAEGTSGGSIYRISHHLEDRTGNEKANTPREADSACAVTTGRRFDVK